MHGAHFEGASLVLLMVFLPKSLEIFAEGEKHYFASGCFLWGGNESKWNQIELNIKNLEKQWKLHLD